MNELSYPFDAAEILGKKRALKRRLSQGAGLADKKIAIVCGSTVGDIKPVLELFLLDGGIRPAFFEGGYGLFYEDVVFDAGALAAFAPDVLYIHTCARNIQAWPCPADSEEAVRQKADAEYARFEAVWLAAKRLGCPVVQNNFELPHHRNFGNMDAWDPRGRVRFVRRLNERFAAFAAENPFLHIHDLAYLAACAGQDAFCDSAAWYAYKYAVAPAHIPDLCHSLAGLIKALFGRTKKAVAADLDNTLWGGVVGDAGAEGIEIGGESPAGLAYADFQGYLAMLAQRGILLAAASKNEAAAAEAGLARGECPLKRDDFLCFEVNWGPKSESVARIAGALNIGADAVVLVDDNPAEREEVRRALPCVETPPVGAPEDSVRLLDRSALFETASLSADDVKRGEMYRQNARREVSQRAAGSYEEYLQSLEMTARIGPFAPEQYERITQLINKTNQFNFTTRRYTAGEVAACAASPGYVTLAGRLADKFGDNGLVSAVIGAVSGGALDIDLWVMSCRVFKRGFEQAMFDALMAEAARRGLKTLRGRYAPTAKNVIVRDLYGELGFSLISGDGGERLYERAVSADYAPGQRAIKVVQKWTESA